MTLEEQLDYIERLVYVYMEDRRCSREELAATPVPYMQAWLELRNKFNAQAQGRSQQPGQSAAPDDKYKNWTRREGNKTTHNVHLSTILDSLPVGIVKIDNTAQINRIIRG